VSAPWGHPEANPLEDIRQAFRAAWLGVPAGDLERLDGELFALEQGLEEP
jgi:hypothetical protein